jgi:hypothetical protein
LTVMRAASARKTRARGLARPLAELGALVVVPAGAEVVVLEADEEPGDC